MMQNFQYRALNSAGKTIKGHIQASSEKIAKQDLKAQGFIVIHLELDKKILHLSRKAKPQDICLFTRQLATMLSAGIPLNDALSGIVQEQTHAHLKQLIQTIHQKILEGYSLAQALKQHHDVFSDLYCASIYAGEQSGQLDHVLLQLADYIEQQERTKQKIKQALIYPSLMLTVALVIIFFLMTTVVPKILSIFDDTQQSLPLMTKILLQTSHLFKILSLPLFILVFAMGLFFYKKRADNAFRKQLDFRLTKFKWYGYFVKMTQIPRYLHTIRILLSSGVNVLESMQVASELISNRAVREKFKAATQQVKEGRAISLALANTKWFSNMTIYLIQSGEKSGQLTHMIERAALQIDSERQQMTDTALKLLEPMIILIMGAFVLFVVLAILLPIFQMQQLV
jgi:general secretion pathway protein F